MRKPWGSSLGCPASRWLPPRLLLLLALVTAAWHASAAELPLPTKFPVSPTCPCLSQEQVATRVFAGRSGGASSFNCSNGLLPASVPEGRFKGVQCLPAELGSGTCRAWDSVLRPVCDSHRGVGHYETVLEPDRAGVAEAFEDELDSTELAHTWCNHGWCYVDPANCYTHARPSTLFPGADLWYSYHTCGFVDTYGPRLLNESLKTLRRNTIRISYPGNDAYRLWRDPNGVVTGSFVKIFERAKATLQAGAGNSLEFITVPVSEDAQTFVRDEFKYSSSYTACAAMVAMNQTDICVGAFWSLKERHMMAQYIYGWESDQFYLVTRVLPPGGGALLGGIFQPFTGDVWLLWMATVLLTIALFGWMEIAPRMAATISAWRAARLEMGKPGTPAPASMGERLKRGLLSTTEVVLMSLEGVLDFHPEGYNPLSNGGKLLKMAYIMFMVMFMATYTANLAAILGGQSKYEFTSLEDAISKKVRICVPEVIQEKLSFTAPGLASLMEVTGYEEMLDGMEDGKCEVAISYDAIDNVRPERHCDKVAVGKPVSVLPVSMVSQSFLARHLSRAVELEVSIGMTTALTTRFMLKYNRHVNNSTGCAENVQDDTQRLSALQMSSLFILFGVAACAAVLVDTLERVFGSRSGGIPFIVADRAKGHCYLRDEYKDTYVLRLPPGLSYPDDDLGPGMVEVSGGVQASDASEWHPTMASNSLRQGIPMPADPKFAGQDGSPGGGEITSKTETLHEDRASHPSV